MAGPFEEGFVVAIHLGGNGLMAGFKSTRIDTATVIPMEALANLSDQPFRPTFPTSLFDQSARPTFPASLSGANQRPVGPVRYSAIISRGIPASNAAPWCG